VISHANHYSTASRASRIANAARLILVLLCVIAGTRGAFAQTSTTTTPIKHLIVIYQENVSFDHYFATYPRALNPPGDPEFRARPGNSDPEDPTTGSGCSRPARDR